MAFQTLAFLGFLALTVLLCHALGRVRPSLGRTALLLGCLYFCWQAGWRGMAVLAMGAAVSFLAGPRAVPGAARPSSGPRRAITSWRCWASSTWAFSRAGR